MRERFETDEGKGGCVGRVMNDTESVQCAKPPVVLTKGFRLCERCARHQFRTLADAEPERTRKRELIKADEVHQRMLREAMVEAGLL